MDSEQEKPSIAPFLTVSLYRAGFPSGTVSLCIEESATEWIITSTDTLLRVRLKKRSAYPVTFCRQINKTTVLCGYGHERQDEYLSITLQGNRLISIVRDNFAVLPLFYYSTKSFFILSNEYATVLESIECPKIRKTAVIDHLMMVDRPALPPIEGVEILHEREKLNFCMDEGVVIEQPPDRDWRYSTDLPESDPKMFFEIFSRHLDSFIENRFSEQTFAFCVSGGLDSATLPQYFFQKTKQPICMVSMLLGPPYDVSQQFKLKAIAEQTHATRIEHMLSPSTMAPLSAMRTPRHSEATYIEAFSPLLRQLSELGVEVLATANGGDELIHNVTNDSFGMFYGDIALRQRENIELATFFTSQFRQDYLASAPSRPISPLPHRSLNIYSNQLVNNLYIREGIWPVSPFWSPELYPYIQGISAHFRAHKRILRAFHQAKGFTRYIYDAKENEYFDEFFTQCMTSGSYDALFEEVLPVAQTVAMGYIDARKVKESYRRAKQHPEETGLAFRLYCFLLLENSLRLSKATL